MHENIEFLQAFIKNPLKVGAIAPSSPELAKKMVEEIVPDEDSVVMELGVGTGSFTKLLHKKVPNKKSYLGEYSIFVFCFFQGIIIKLKI